MLPFMSQFFQIFRLCETQNSSNDFVLAINSGSSSLKFVLFRERNGEETAVLHGAAEGIGQQSGRLRIQDAGGHLVHDESYTLSSQTHATGEVQQALMKSAGVAPTCVGHGGVHGGPHFREHQRIIDRFVKEN